MLGTLYFEYRNVRTRQVKRVAYGSKDQKVLSSDPNWEYIGGAIVPKDKYDNANERALQGTE